MRGIDVQDIGAENPIIYQDGFRIWPWKEVEDAATQRTSRKTSRAKHVTRSHFNDLCESDFRWTT